MEQRVVAATRSGFDDGLSDEECALDPRYVDGYRHWQRGSELGALKPHVRELIGMAVNASVTTLNLSGMRRHLRYALEHGATRRQVLEALELVSVVGIHCFNTAAPIVLEEFGVTATDLSARHTTPEQDAIRVEWERRRGRWPESFTNWTKLAQEFIAGYGDYSSAPWDSEDGLEPKEREFILVAMNAVTTHLFLGGIRFHTRSAIEHGATQEELLEVLAVSSLISMQTFSHGARALLEYERSAGTDT
jgi:alkylhydroperoxidase/carboxymuconolactone decarboxylase family protein YurZ